jgi:hypothetical protein
MADTPPTMPPNETLVAKYIELRDEAAALQQRHDAEMKPIKDKMALLESFFANKLHEEDATSFKYTTGLVRRAAKTTYTPVDRSAFFDWVRETGNSDLLEGRISQSAVKEWVGEHGVLPPGVHAKTAYAVSFLRPKTA